MLVIHVNFAVRINEKGKLKGVCGHYLAPVGTLGPNLPDGVQNQNVLTFCFHLC